MKFTVLYDSFFQKFGHIPSFLRRSELTKLTDRLNEACRSHRIDLISTKNPQLWKDFLELEKTRHFLIHPAPYDTEVNKIARRIILEEPYKKYPGTAAQVIKYFYDSFSTECPSYINQNILFQIRDIDVLF
jgi:hypothetical protein